MLAKTFPVQNGGQLNALNGTVIGNLVTITLNGTFASGSVILVLVSSLNIVGQFSNVTLTGNSGQCQSASLQQTGTSVSVLVSAATGCAGSGCFFVVLVREFFILLYPFGGGPGCVYVCAGACAFVGVFGPFFLF